MGMLMLISVFAQAQGKVRIDDSSRKVVAQQSSKSSETTVIPWTYVDRDGKEYPIYMSESGSCFIYKTGKDGKLKKNYLGKETSQELCKKLNVEYRPRRKK